MITNEDVIQILLPANFHFELKVFQRSNPWLISFKDNFHIILGYACERWMRLRIYRPSAATKHFHWNLLAPPQKRDKKKVHNKKPGKKQFLNSWKIS